MNEPCIASPVIPLERWQIVQMYTKNVRFVVQELTSDLIAVWNPQISLQANPRYEWMSGDRYEAILALRIQLQQAGKRLAEIDIEQAGIFVFTDLLPAQQEAILYGVGCNTLFGVIGVHIHYLLTQAELPPVYLTPLDFVSLYQRFRQQQANSTQSQQPFAVFFDPKSGQLKE